MNRLPGRARPPFVLVVFVALAASAGCNNAHTLRSNYDRSVDARREAAEQSRTTQRPTAPNRLFPPFNRTASASDDARGSAPRPPAPRPPAPRLEDDGPVFPQLMPARDGLQSSADDDDEVIEQTSAQFPAAGSVVAGRVVDSTGRPQPGVTVVATATRRPGGARVESRTDRQGGFVLRGLATGERYLVLATAANSREPLIGRVAAIAPDQDVVIEIARPFAAHRSTRPAGGSVTQGNPTARPSLAPTRVAENQPNVQRELWNRPPTGTPPTPVSPPQARKKTMQDVVAENHRESPWNMPAPPQRRTPPQTVASAAPNSDWQPAGERKPYQARKIDHSLFDPLPTDKPLSDSHGPDPNDSPSTNEPSQSPPVVVDPTRPLSQPLDVAATPKSASPLANTSKPEKLNVELEPANSSSPASPAAPEPLAYAGPRCVFDGSRLDEFQLPDLNDKPVSFSRLGGRLVLVDFWGSWCGYCVKSMPHLVSLQRRYGPLGLQVVGIAYEQGPANERVSRVREVRDQLGVNYPILLGDGDGKCPVHEKFGILHYPTLVLLDSSGRVLWRREGPDEKDMQQLEKLIKSRLAAAP